MRPHNFNIRCSVRRIPAIFTWQFCTDGIPKDPITQEEQDVVYKARIMGHSVISLDFSVDSLAAKGITLYLDDALSIEFGPLAEWTMEFAQHMRSLLSEYCSAGL